MEGNDEVTGRCDDDTPVLRELSLCSSDKYIEKNNGEWRAN